MPIHDQVVFFGTSFCKFPISIHPSTERAPAVEPRVDRTVRTAEVGGSVMRVGAALTVGVVLVAGLTIPALAQDAGQVFDYSGAPETFTVPTGVTAIQVSVSGARGGGPSGGSGAHFDAVLDVSAGEVLQINVGESGSAGRGGWNGGGHPGVVGGPGVGRNFGGGGATDIRRGACATTATCGLADRIVVAGGGGGGNTAHSSVGAPNGGSGGTPTGTEGGRGRANGGAGGTSDDAGVGGSGSLGSGTATGGSGDIGSGGSGARNSNDTSPWCAGAGGGGGWFGGGGGGADTGSCDSAGGGGGGSSHHEPATTSAVQYSTATSWSSGEVVITPASSNAATVVTAPPSPVTGRTAVLRASATTVDATARIEFQIGRSAGLNDSSMRRVGDQSVAGPGVFQAEFAISGLDASARYFVRAIISDDHTQARGNVLSFTTAGPPSAPAAPIGVPLAAVGSVNVRWVAPRHNGAPITHYTATASPGGKSCSTSSTAPATAALSCVVEGLDPQTRHLFQVVASSDAGNSTASPWSHPVVPGARSVPISVTYEKALVRQRGSRFVVRSPHAIHGTATVAVGNRAVCTTTMTGGKGRCRGKVRGNGRTSVRAIFEGAADDAGATGAAILATTVRTVSIDRVRVTQSKCRPVLRIRGRASSRKTVTVRVKKRPRTVKRFTRPAQSGIWRTRIPIVNQNGRAKVVAALGKQKMSYTVTLAKECRR